MLILSVWINDMLLSLDVYSCINKRLGSLMNNGLKHIVVTETKLYRT